MITSTSLLQPLREEHRELLPRIQELRTMADLLDTAPVQEAECMVDDAAGFLQSQLAPHAAAEEAVLYPAVEEAMGAPGTGITDTMSRDHVEVMRLIGELEIAKSRLAAEGSSEPVRRELRRILYGLHAVVGLHFAKEEEVYVPVLEKWLTPDRAERLFADLERAADRARAAI